VLGSLVEETILAREVVDEAAHEVVGEDKRNLILSENWQNLFKDLESPVLALVRGAGIEECG
jgi:hypothetical protein